VEDVDHWWFIENFSLRHRPLYEAGKRVSDILISITIMAITLPLLPFIALAVKSTPGSLFFKQLRTGRHGRTFLAMKFRSMVSNAEANGPQWSSHNDPRITRAGRFLRATRLDEIPQLVNILRGDMSFVGPRPERPEFVNRLQEQIPFYQERHLVKPGLTGWAQINYPYGDSAEDALEKLRYDLYYIKNRSLMLDVSTVLKTINTVLRGLGR
jgi:lipopolysaccharide/colanic/teichoic acid biosynthesis glycosyltransferase